MKILFTPITSSSIAHIVRSFALADRFIRDGHEVFFTSCTSKKDFIESRGYKVVKTYKPFNFNDDDDQSLNYMESHKKELVGWFKAEIEAAQEIQPDVVISSPSFLGAHVYHATGIPVVALMNGQYPPTSRGLMGISLASNSPRNFILRQILRPIFKKNFIANYLTHVLDAYRILGIQNDIKTIEDLYADMPILIPGDEKFEPQTKMLKKDRFVGPLFWEGFERLNGDLSEDSLIAFKDDQKLIFITFGGSVFDKEIYDRIFRSLSKINAKKIVALGPNFDRKDFPSDTDDMIIRNFVPGLRVSRISDVIVNTGSQGAIMQAMCSGKPVVAFPVGIDQSYFGNRLEEMGLGINVNKTGILNFSKRESYQFVNNEIPEEMIKAIQRILKDGSFQKRAFEYSLELHARHPKPIEEVASYIYENYKK